MTNEQWSNFNSIMFSGFDTDMTMLRISAMNLMLHSITHPTIDYKNSVSEKNDIDSEYTVCLANPPFKGTVDAETISTSLKAVTNTKKTELLFLALFLRILKKVVVLPALFLMVYCLVAPKPIRPCVRN